MSTEKSDVLVSFRAKRSFVDMIDTVAEKYEFSRAQTVKYIIKKFVENQQEK